jgi:hypothetical protein
MLLCALANGHSTPGGDLPESNHSSDWTLVCVQSPAVNLQAAQTVPISMCAASPIQEMCRNRRQNAPSPCSVVRLELPFSAIGEASRVVSGVQERGHSGLALRSGTPGAVRSIGPEQAVDCNGDRPRFYVGRS